MNDLHHMHHALALGRRTMGGTGDNPAVGCVIVQDGVVVGAGWTGEGGAPHAEATALASAGDRARGATAYVTLEPCCHHGRTPPCCEALVSAGIARVVASIMDPDPRVSGQGYARLREAGIVVETGLLAEEARCDLAGFLSRVTRGRPFVTVKLAMSADGMIAEAPGRRTAITGEAANARSHLLRSRVDAIMVGARTVTVDDPILTCRLPGLEHRTPVAVVIDGKLSIEPTARLVREAARRPLWVMTSNAQDGTLTGLGVEVIAASAPEKGKVDLPLVMAELGRRGIGRVLVEGGAILARNIVAAGLADELMLFESPVRLGPKGVPASISVNGFSVVAKERLGMDTLTIYEKS